MKVLLVEDSATVAAYVASIMGGEPDMDLLPVATTAQDGVRLTLERRPDVVLMDMKLPDHDGLWAIEQIMSASPCPIVVLSGHLSSRERDITFESLRAGAVEVLAKPTGLSPQVREAFRANLVSTVRLMSTAVVVRRTRRGTQGFLAVPDREVRPLAHARDAERIQYLLVGASTGGPELLYRTLSRLSAPLPLPVLITQHTLEGFDESLAQWLSCTGHRVTVAREGGIPTQGQVLLAPADKHMKVSYAGITLVDARRGEPLSSVDTMFESAAKVWGERCLAILLTGMGKDGSAGMRALFDRGSMTVVQAPETCVVSSMPEHAQARGAVQKVLHPDEIVALLRQVAQTQGPSMSSSEVRKGR